MEAAPFEQQFDAQQLSQTDVEAEEIFEACDCALENCPGVLQLPGACETILNQGDLCYCNNGWYHTDWDHNISVDKTVGGCDDCGKTTKVKKVKV